MPVIKTTELILDQRFDPRTCRHTLNGQLTVLHCHHYATLYAQLAEDCSMLDGKALLAECAEDAYHEIFTRYYRDHAIQTVPDRITIAEQYYVAAGLGRLKVVCAGADSGEVELDHSHVDAGWIKKWGRREQPVNSITCGYVAALFGAVYDRPPRSYLVSETASMVSGAPASRFHVVVK